MSLVMDGVVRRGPVLVPPLPRKVLGQFTAPAVQATTTHWVTGIDGLRRPRPVARSPRAMLDMAMPAAATAAAIPPPLLAVPASQDVIQYEDESTEIGQSYGRKIAFGLVAAALVASSGIGLGHLAGQITKSTAQASSVQVEAPSVSTSSSETTTPTQPTAAQLAAASAVQSTGLQQILNDFVQGHAGEFGIVVKDLKTGASASVDADRSMTSASLYKLFVAQQIYSQIDTGNLVYARDAGGGSGRNIDACLTIMINISDNTCGRALGSILNWGAQNPQLKADGYTGTSLTTPQQTSAQDVAALFERLYRGTLNSPASNDRFMTLLKDQRVNDRLPVGLPAGTVIAHKTGDLDGYMHDAGIVYGPKTDYSVVVMGAPGTNSAQFADLSAKLWAALEN